VPLDQAVAEEPIQENGHHAEQQRETETRLLEANGVRDDDGTGAEEGEEEEDISALASAWNFDVDDAPSDLQTAEANGVGNGQNDHLQSNGVVDAADDAADEEEWEGAGLTPEARELVRRERQQRRRAQREFDHFREQSLTDLTALQRGIVALTRDVEDDRANATRLKRRNWMLQKNLERAQHEVQRLEQERAVLVDELARLRAQAIGSALESAETERREREAEANERESEVRRVMEAMDAELRRFKADLAAMIRFVNAKKQKKRMRKHAQLQPTQA
jgi:hypothetical protein